MLCPARSVANPAACYAQSAPPPFPNESGKNISMIMPAPFSQRHNGYLRNYLTTGKARILDSIREVVALHKERFVFPIRLAVTRVSGSGADSVFMVRNLAVDCHLNALRGWLAPWGQAPCCPAHAEGAVLRTDRCSRARALPCTPLTPFLPSIDRRSYYPSETGRHQAG